MKSFLKKYYIFLTLISFWLIYSLFYLELKQSSFTKIYAGFLPFICEVGLDIITALLAFYLWKKTIDWWKRIIFALFSIAFFLAAITDISFNFIVNILGITDYTFAMASTFEIPYLGFLICHLLVWSIIFSETKPTRSTQLILTAYLPIIMITFMVIVIFLLSSFTWKIQVFSLLGFYPVLDAILQTLSFILASLCLAAATDKRIRFIIIGYLIVIASAFTVQLSHLTNTIKPLSLMDDTWVLGLLLIVYGFYEMLKDPPNIKLKQWLNSINSIQAQSAFWSFLLCMVALIAFWIITYIFDRTLVFRVTLLQNLPSLLIIFSIFAVLISSIFARTFSAPFQRTQSIVNSYLSEKDLDISQQKCSSNIDEFEQLENFITKAFDVLREKNRTMAAFADCAAKVAHDLRSPVATLRAIANHLPEVEEQKRQAIQHSVDMLNDLAHKVLRMAQGKTSEVAVNHHEPEPIAMLLDRLVSEKRSQLTGKTTKLTLEVKPNAYGLFVDMDLIEFKRTLANLINNALEAVEGNKAEKIVKVQLALSGNSVQILIEDNGCGISKELLPKILAGGITNKKEGYGLGVGAAKKMIESWDGTFSIESQETIGSKVTITLPRAKEASWFACQIDIMQGVIVAVLDDDKSIHYLWEERFKVATVPTDEIQLQQFYVPKDLIEFQLNHVNENIFFLIDYELLNSEMNGLDVIEQLDIANQAYLVTSRYECADVRTGSKKLKVKILPKNYVPYTPIRVIKRNPDCVFLDDNEAVTFIWKLAADEKGKRLEVFNDIRLFKEYVKHCKKDILIYIDSELQSEEKGEDIAKELNELGYYNIYLASGYPSGHFEQVTWVKGIVGKDPPF